DDLDLDVGVLLLERVDELGVGLRARVVVQRVDPHDDGAAELLGALRRGLGSATAPAASGGESEGGGSGGAGTEGTAARDSVDHVSSLKHMGRRRGSAGGPGVVRIVVAVVVRRCCEQRSGAAGGGPNSMANDFFHASPRCDPGQLTADNETVKRRASRRGGRSRAAASSPG